MALDERHVIGETTTDAVRTVETANHRTSRIAGHEGLIMPVADISSPAPHCTTSLPVLILRMHRHHVALVVDSIREAVELASDQIHISEEPQMSDKNYIHGHFVLRSSIIVVMDVERFLSPLLNA